VDTTFYLDVNRFARRTAWAHPFMHDYALYGGALLLAFLVFVAFLRARRSWLGDSSTRRVAATWWTAAATLIALGLNQPLSHAIGRVRPYYTLRHVEVLVPKTHDFTMPSDHATVAGAVIVGLWLSRDRLLATVATVLGLFLAFARVYVGAHYPGDVLAGLAFGGFVAGAGYAVSISWIESLVTAIGRSPIGWLVGVQHRAPPASAGPAAEPVVLAATGAVRIIRAPGTASPPLPGAGEHGPQPTT
jgi:undecaprenyl-diphosphatase